jgi:hypothetical protein
MLNSLSLDPFYRETWGSFNPLAIAQLSPMAYDDCYDPKYYKAPDDDQELMGGTDVNGNPIPNYLKYGLEITPGSIIWGIYHQPANGTDDPGFVFKITDMSLGVEIFSSPTPDLFVTDNEPGFRPWFFNAPYPVVGSGLFNVEFWNQSGGQLRVNLVFGVCEVRQCAY